MAAIEQKLKELEDVRAVRLISSALFEISAARMQELRVLLGENARYFEEIEDVYELLRQSAAARDHAAISSRSKKADTISVAFTTNKRFYGSINKEVVDTFLARTRGSSTDCLVIGATGRNIIEHTKHAPACQFHTFAGEQPRPEEMRSFLRLVRPYERVFLYYPRFESVFRQVVATKDITYTSDRGTRTERIDYIFEPELPQLLDFFERRVRFLLFQRAMLEMELARTAARFAAMTNAEQHSATAYRKLKRAIDQLQNADANRQLLESLSGFVKWKAL